MAGPKKAPASGECGAAQKHLFARPSSAAQKAESSGSRCRCATVAAGAVGQLSRRRQLQQPFALTAPDSSSRARAQKYPKYECGADVGLFLRSRLSVAAEKNANIWSNFI